MNLSTVQRHSLAKIRQPREFVALGGTEQSLVVAIHQVLKSPV